MESISWRSILIHFNSFYFSPSILIHFNSFCFSPSILIRFNSFYSSPSILLHFNSFYFSLSISIHSILVQANPYFGYFLGLPDLRTTVFSLRIALIYLLASLRESRWWVSESVSQWVIISAWFTGWTLPRRSGLWSLDGVIGSHGVINDHGVSSRDL